MGTLQKHPAAGPNLSMAGEMNTVSLSKAVTLTSPLTGMCVHQVVTLLGTAVQSNVI